MVKFKDQRKNDRAREAAPIRRIVMAGMDPEQRKELIEELKIVQDLLLKQEAYAVGALNQGFAIMAGLVIAHLNYPTKFNSEVFFIVGEIVFVGFLYVQAIYRQAFFDGLERSWKLQIYLRDGIPAGDTFTVFGLKECFHDPAPKWKRFFEDLKNPRFSVPNAMLFLTPIVILFIEYIEALKSCLQGR
jgi:hypothetical protein